MPKRGLGRGLDALIPDRNGGSSSGKKKQSGGKTASKGNGKRSNKEIGKENSQKSGKSAAKAAAKEPVKEPVTAAAEKPMKEPAKAAAKEPAKEPVKAASKGSVKTQVKTAAKEPEKESANASAKEPAKEPVKAASKEQEKTAAKQPPKDEKTSVKTAKKANTAKSEPAAKNTEADEAYEDKDGSVSGDAEFPDAEDSGKVVNVRLSLVEPNRDQPRKYFDDDAISELADSIRQYGIIQPLLVQKKEGYYEIIAGERRWRAAQKAGLLEVPVIIRQFSSREAVEVALVENIQREDLNPIEEAKAYERLVEEYGLSQEEVAGRVSKSRSAVTNSMRLLRLEDSVQKMVETARISEGHARALLGLSDPEKQKSAAEKVVKDHLSVRQTEKLVRDENRPDDSSKTKKADQGTGENAMLQGLAENLKTVLGTKVTINPQGKERGRIEIEYYSGEELDRIYELLLGISE